MHKYTFKGLARPDFSEYKGAMLRLGFVFLLLPLGCASLSGLSQVQDPLRSELEDFSGPNWKPFPGTMPIVAQGSPFVPEAGPAVSQYRAHLAGVPWGAHPVWHRMGTLPLSLQGGNTLRLAVNVFQPEGISKGTLLFLHGYRAHAGDFAYTLAWFASRGWRVVTLDLPGHGISEGVKEDIGDFAEYGDAVTVWMTWVFDKGWPGPKVLLAHSLGAAAALEALRRIGSPRPDRVVFCAPLLHTTWYPALSLTDFALGWLFTSVRAVHWFHELELWLARLTTQPPLDLSLVIYSGDRDSVVDASWNQQRFRQLVPGARWVTLPGKGHWFLSASEDREAFHERLTAELDSEFLTPLRQSE